MTIAPSMEDTQPTDSASTNRLAIEVGLAIEVIGRDGSIALMKGDEIAVARSLDADSRAASSLIPAIAELLRAERPSLAPDFVSVAIGPGSFTGLRIAVAAAKTLAFAWEIPLVEVDSLSAIAAIAPLDANPESPGWKRKSPQRPVFVGLSAYRGQVFRGRFPSTPERDPSISMLTRSEWEEELHGIANEHLSGPASEQTASDWLFAGDRIAFERSKVEIPDRDWAPQTHPRAVGVGLVGIQKFRAGQTVSPMNAAPNYFRPSAAEEKESSLIGDAPKKAVDQGNYT